MSISGVIQNAKWVDLVLTETTSGAKVDGQSFAKTDNQRWVGEYDYQPEKGQNKASGDYLAWDADMKVVMNGSRYWWKLVFKGGFVGFQVPEKKSASDSEASANATSFYTLELETDKSVTCPIDRGGILFLTPLVAGHPQVPGIRPHPIAAVEGGAQMNSLNEHASGRFRLAVSRIGLVRVDERDIQLSWRLTRNCSPHHTMRDQREKNQISSYDVMVLIPDVELL
ncbi:hypothetical protein EDD22DRAFT_846378 [Suillus occidentalis]|nr:hypothetical protein EDD22DRAFT_846378 [Suillus occidentalis]